MGDATVTLPDAPQRASCTCPAGGACRHILVAILAMRSGGRDAVAPEPGITDSPSAGSPASALPEVLALDDATLQKWAGKPLFRKALRRLANGLEVVIEGGAPLTIAIPALQITCRWFPGAGFDGMLCGCHAAGPCEHRVLAILGVQARHGRAIVAEAAAMLEAASGAPRTRAEVLAAVGGMLHELVIHGFSCAADATVERMQTLAVSAHGVDLPRLERLLETLAEETRLLLARSAAADTHNLLGAAAQAAALRLALAARPTARLVGEHRSRYDDIGTLELAGMGARRWRTRSGYVGLTVYFWDAVSHAWATWSDARPAEQAEQFDPARRYLADGPWPGCACPGEAARSRLRLM
ncbi:MAG TPA: SWIM zinc finger family protein, partial [Armatimonadota bacterium]|nr:SWIM zinc finger family protein [Armatimonadota bacterium]